MWNKRLELKEMEKYILTVLGIVVSVVLFLLRYRYIVGARKERAYTAKREIVNTLLKIFLFESYQPSQSDVIKIIEGKAILKSVRKSDLYSPHQILNILFVKIIEMENISSEQREYALVRLNNVIV